MASTPVFSSASTRTNSPATSGSTLHDTSLATVDEAGRA